jgi:AraC-like DNA-binding protein
MSTWSLIDTINVISVFFLVFFSFFLLTHKKGKRVSNRMLGLFLLTVAFVLLNFVLSRENRLPSFFLMVFLLMNAFSFVMGPLLYFYVRSVVYRDFAWRKGYLVHTIPLALYLLLLAAVAVMDPSSFVNIGHLRKSFFGAIAMPIFTGIISLQLLFYLGASFWALRSYRVRLRNSFSSLDKINLGWLSLIIGGIGLIWLIGAGNSLVAMSIGEGRPWPWLSIANMLIIFAIANLVIIKGLKQPEIFLGIEEKPKYEKSPLTDDEAKRLEDTVKDFMESKKPHLVPGLSLSDLAKGMAVAPRALSQTINSRLRKNFVDFVNFYRIEEAKRLLSGSGGNGKTILEIAYEAGFNSKSVFNKAFKKHAGVPPKEFRKKAGAGERTADFSQK